MKKDGNIETNSDVLFLMKYSMKLMNMSHSIFGFVNENKKKYLFFSTMGNRGGLLGELGGNLLRSKDFLHSHWYREFRDDVGGSEDMKFVILDDLYDGILNVNETLGKMDRSNLSNTSVYVSKVNQGGPSKLQLRLMKQYHCDQYDKLGYSGYVPKKGYMESSNGLLKKDNNFNNPFSVKGMTLRTRMVQYRGDDDELCPMLLLEYFKLNKLMGYGGLFESKAELHDFIRKEFPNKVIDVMRYVDNTPTRKLFYKKIQL